MSINLTDEIEVKTKKGKLGAAKQIFLEGDSQNVQKEIEGINSRHDTLNTKHESLSKTVQGIAATGGASTATNVTYDNTNSGMAAENIQDAVDKLAKEKADSSDVTEQLDKVTIKNEDGTVVNTPFRYIQNEEFIFAKVDAEDKLLFGIQWDGTPKFGKTSEVEDKLQEQITLLAKRVAAIVGDDDITSTIDTLNELKTFFANIENTQSLTDILANLDKTTIKDEEGNVQDTPFKVIENEEFIKAIVDSEDRVLFGIYRATGKPYYPLNDMYHIYHNDEFLWVVLDAANHPLLGIKEDGTCWAAKAQWLDDIKAIKEALSGIDDTFKTFQPKEDGKGLINMEIADSFFYISNDEYIIAVVDAEDRILAGIKYDGEPYFPNHEMYSVITNEEWLYAIIDAEEKVLGGFRADDGHMIVGSIDISNFIANAIIDIADINKRIAHLSTIENNEYLSIETDADGKVLGYTAPDGSHYMYKVKSETIPEEFEHIEDPEGRTEITTDAEGKIMSYRDSEGKKHEHSMEATNLDVSNLNLQGNSVNNIQEALKANGFDVKHPMDWSTKNELQIPEPYCAFVNITGSFPTLKGHTTKGEIQFYDMQGNYFKKFIEMDIHGRTSAMYKKKNYTFDFYNDADCSDAFTIKFGDWVSMDSFYFQGWYSDAFRGIDIIEYKLYQQMISTRGFLKDKPYKYSIWQNVTSKGNEDSKKLDNNLEKNALCTPMGFPVIMYLNGEFWGIYTIMLKKNRANFRMDKKDYKSVMLDLDNGSIVSGNKNWESFEIRNPKVLICMDGSKYNGDAPKELIDESSEKYDASNKDMINTVLTKNAIVSLADSYNKVKELDSLSKSSDEIRTTIERYYNVDYIIDYIIFSNLIQNADGWGGNWQWTTWDGVKWNPNPYDLNASLGLDPYGLIATSPVERVSSGAIAAYVYKYYITEIKDRYKYLKNSKIISIDNIIGLFYSWIKRIGTDNYANEFKKWNSTPSQRESYLNSKYWDVSEGPKTTSYYPAYSDSVSYSKGQVVRYNSGFYQSIIGNNIGNVLTDSTKWKTMLYDENTTYEIGDELICTSTIVVKFKCIKSCIGQKPVTKEYDENFGILGFYDSIGRIYKWFEEKITYLDSIWNI